VRARIFPVTSAMPPSSRRMFASIWTRSGVSLSVNRYEAEMEGFDEKHSLNFNERGSELLGFKALRADCMTEM